MSAAKPSRRGIRHGTTYGYNSGCRCDECRAARTNYVHDWRARGRAANSESYQREQAANKLRKQGYGGTCEICGARTDGSNGRAKAPTRCAKHNRGAEKARARAGKGALQTWIVGLLETNGPMRFTDIVAASGTSPGSACVALVRMVQSGQIVRLRRGVYSAPGPRPFTNPATR